MVNFIHMGLLELWGSRVDRELQNEKFLPTVGFEPGPAWRERATTAVRGLIPVSGFYLSVLFVEIRNM